MLNSLVSRSGLSRLSTRAIPTTVSLTGESKNFQLFNFSYNEKYSKNFLSERAKLNGIIGPVVKRGIITSRPNVPVQFDKSKINAIVNNKKLEFFVMKNTYASMEKATDTTNNNNKSNDESPFKVIINKSEFETLDDVEIVGSIVEPLLTYVKKHTWSVAKTQLSQPQQYVYAFFQADELITFEGFLPFFYKGGGECFDELIAGLDEIKETTMKNLIIKATREIEEPAAWKLFSELKDRISVETGEPEELLSNERFISIFHPLRIIYEDYRKSTTAKYAQYIKQHLDSFVELK